MEIQSKINLENFEKKMNQTTAKQQIKTKIVEELRNIVHKKNNQIRAKKIVGAAMSSTASSVMK